MELCYTLEIPRNARNDGALVEGDGVLSVCQIASARYNHSFFGILLKRLTMSEEQSFEQNLSELEKIVKELEQGDLKLEEALNKYEQGVSLTKKCQKTLTEAEQKIEYLNQNNQEDKPDA